MWNNEVTLIHEVDYVIDDIGQANKKEETITVLAQERQITNAMLFYANQFNFKLSLVLAIHTYEYTGQTIIFYNGKRYTVKRCYKESNEITELQCEELGNRGNKH